MTMLRCLLSLPVVLLAAEHLLGEVLTYERDIRPIFKEHCFQCHGEAGVRKGNLDVRLKRFLVQGGESGAAIVPGKPDESYLLDRLRSGEMPPGDDASKKVSDEEVARIERWIRSGSPTARDEPELLTDELLITAEERAFWSFQPIERPPVPEVQHAEMVRNPIDAFVLRRLEEQGMGFSPPADSVTLLRRAYFDLHGLPPTPEAADQFERDTSSSEWPALIDSLLDSPRYGERWARHWLDVAGYSDSEGYTEDDVERTWAWKYRDWVIRAINSDMPFDQFVRWQLAGDEMVTPPYAELPSQDLDKLIATGFLRMGPDGTGGKTVDANLAKNEVIAETIKIVSTSLLGLTVGCAQCHDHRYDPIPQTDYYRFRAVFEPGYNPRAWRNPKSRLVSLYTSADREAAAAIEQKAKAVEAERTKKQQEFIDRTLEKELAKLPEEIRETVRGARDTPQKERTPEQTALLKKYPSTNVSAGSLYLYDRKAADELKKMADQAAKLRGEKPAEEFVRAMTEVSGKVPETYLFYRGDHEQPKQAVEPGDLSVLICAEEDKDCIPVNNDTIPTTGRRLAFAGRLTDGSHPLLARVFVNRVWMHHFGRGLVNTPSDFGYLGDRPTHPELLNWLAAEFMASGWSLKELHRLIMTSTAYQQSLCASDERDPDNTLFGGTRMRRLEAEVVRDSLLAISGKLNEKRFGPPVPVMADRVGQFVVGQENLNAGRPGAVIPMKGEEFRRTIYIQARRSRPLTILDTFDLPRMEPNCEKRNSSTVPTQSLLMMNSEQVTQMADLTAQRVMAEVGDDVPAQISLAWRLAYSRQPSAEESQQAKQFLRQQTEHFEKHPVKQAATNTKTDADDRNPAEVAFGTLCQAIFSSNEFLYVD